MKSCDIEANPVGGGAPCLFVTGICYVMLCYVFFILIWREIALYMKI